MCNVGEVTKRKELPYNSTAASSFTVCQLIASVLQLNCFGVLISNICRHRQKGSRKPERNRLTQEVASDHSGEFSSKRNQMFPSEVATDQKKN